MHNDRKFLLLFSCSLQKFFPRHFVTSIFPPVQRDLLISHKLHSPWLVDQTVIPLALSPAEIAAHRFAAKQFNLPHPTLQCSVFPNRCRSKLSPGFTVRWRQLCSVRRFVLPDLIADN
jgi:hypothetical protein